MDLLYSLTAATAPSQASSHSRASLEHHNAVLRTHPAAGSATTSRRDSPCVWCKRAGRICSAASVRPPLQVGPPVTRGRHWSTTTPSSGLNLLQARPRQRGETLRAPGRSVRDGSVVQPQCGHRSKSGQQSLAGVIGAPQRHPPDSLCCRLGHDIAARLSVCLAEVCASDL